MSLIKSILLGSAAGIVAVASAQAADLPTKKAAPVEQYVKICNVGGITGWTLPGSDTCVKLSGYITAQFAGGNLSTQYNCGVDHVARSANDPFAASPIQPSWSRAATRLRQSTTPLTGKPTSTLSASCSPPATRRGNTIFNRNATGWSTRAKFGFDFASNTAYGPLIGHFDLQATSATASTRSTAHRQLTSRPGLPDLGRHHRR